jgi:putative colanic acid biosynthesis acetyltransferase WcaF
MPDSDSGRSDRPPTVYQDLAKFRIPEGFRGRPAWFVQVWWLTQSTVFRWSPQVAYGFRAALLRVFGAKVGRDTIIRPSATITYPWKVELGDRVWLGDEVVLYSLGNIKIGSNTVISQRSYLCAGDHDHTESTFPIRSSDICIGDQVWIATDCFIAPGVQVGSFSVVGARSSVFRSLPSAKICYGSPCKVVADRQFKD